jgi:hypothetical protein
LPKAVGGPPMGRPATPPPSNSGGNHSGGDPRGFLGRYGG